MFEKLKDLIVDSLICNVNNQRRIIIDQDCADFEACTLIRTLVDAILDLSLNELNVYFKDHSKIKFEGPYEYINSYILEKSFEYYEALECPLDDLTVYFENEHKFCQSVFPQSTTLDLKSLKYKKIQCEIFKTVSNNLLAFEPRLEEIDIGQYHNILSSDLGVSLLRIDSDRKKIAEFLGDHDQDYLKNFENLSCLLNIYELTEEDELIERRAAMLGVRMNVSPEEITLFSFSRDVSLTQLSGVFKAFSIY